MKNVGIICEYNPFHKGHKYQLEKAREITGADNVICIMSGSFMQRGEPAGWDKWTRAKMALLNGADLVIELPVVFSCQAADYFATGAVKLLNQMKIVDALCFGSEIGNIDGLQEIASVLVNEPDDLKVLLRTKLDEGLVFPKAYQLAVTDFLNQHKNKKFDTEPLGMNTGTPEVLSLLSNPNNILGLEYMKALLLSNSKMKPFTIKRKGSGYNDEEISQDLASATAIRKEIKECGFSSRLIETLPVESVALLEKAFNSYEKIVEWEDFREILFYKLRSTEPEELREYAYIIEGIENRILKVLPSVHSVNELIELIKTKRFTRTAIQRMLTAILLGIKKADISSCKNLGASSYIRVLGFNKKGAKVLREMKILEVENVITKLANFKTTDPLLNRMLVLDVRSTEIFHGALEKEVSRNTNGVLHGARKAGLIDYLHSPIII